MRTDGSKHPFDLVQQHRATLFGVWCPLEQLDLPLSPGAQGTVANVGTLDLVIGEFDNPDTGCVLEVNGGARGCDSGQRGELTVANPGTDRLEHGVGNDPGVLSERPVHFGATLGGGLLDVPTGITTALSTPDDDATVCQIVVGGVVVDRLKADRFVHLHRSNAADTGEIRHLDLPVNVVLALDLGLRAARFSEICHVSCLPLRRRRFQPLTGLNLLASHSGEHSSPLERT